MSLGLCHQLRLPSPCSEKWMRGSPTKPWNIRRVPGCSSVTGVCCSPMFKAGVRSKKQMNEIEELQTWYRAQCNDDWEHSWGVKIGTLDNPGWTLTINLKDTSLEHASFTTVAYRVGEGAEPDDENWYVCKVEDCQFKGHAGPHHLKTLLRIFLDWQKSK